MPEQPQADQPKVERANREQVRRLPLQGEDQDRKGEREGNADHREGKRPGKAVGLDQQRRAYPPQAGKEIAEAEPPADGEGRPQAPKQAAGGFAGRAVEQPDQQRKRNETDGEEIVGRLDRKSVV